MVGGGCVGSATHTALAVFLALALRGGFDDRVHASTGGGVDGPDFLVGAIGVLNGDVVSVAGASRAFLLVGGDWCGGCCWSGSGIGVTGLFPPKIDWWHGVV
jgi:hypothetical protein